MPLPPIVRIGLSQRSEPYHMIWIDESERDHTHPDLPRRPRPAVADRRRDPLRPQAADGPVGGELLVDPALSALRRARPPGRGRLPDRAARADGPAAKALRAHEQGQTCPRALAERGART